ncbi:hypothetical protein AVEN_53360-1 [Araneus ventricosus]|uniref:Uncharacterized protein n=1 Tax=Araneus ventricosus TaxID=182803 RepID=A0A4Y2AAR1_ARAVE|nr:hypothetical protein AVEN_53360-1 [Araneus ventricosus]
MRRPFFQSPETNPIAPLETIASTLPNKLQPPSKWNEKGPPTPLSPFWPLFEKKVFREKSRSTFSPRRITLRNSSPSDRMVIQVSEKKNPLLS